MDLQVLLFSANLMQSSIVVITLFANVPQWVTIYKNKTSENLSLSSWYMWLMASFFGLFYAVVNQCAYGNCAALLFSTGVSFLCNAYTIHLILKYRAKESDILSQPLVVVATA